MTKSKVGKLVKLACDTRIAPSVTDRFIHSYLQAIDSPRSLAVWLLYENREHLQLTKLTVEPKNYCSSSAFRDAYIATKFLSKADFLETGIDRKAVAMSKFDLFEVKCGEQNRYFRNLLSHPNFSDENVRLLSLARRKIASILGTFSAEEFVSNGNWGPGVSTLIKGEEVSAFNKFRDERGITRDLYSLIREWFHLAYPLWKSEPLTLTGEGALTLQSGNTVTTVPKDSKTDRVIAIEPGFNLWFQQAIGTMIVKRLRRVGIDLTTQENNQHAAWLSSKDDSLATVDFSSASDSISSAVVEDLLPQRWFTLMNSSRSQYRQGEDFSVKWNKFSSMGNAFTFPLQSLIFYACAWAVLQLKQIKGTILVFGDDVLLPREAFSTYSSFTEFLGFTVNTDKSYSQGYFRESCGAHYYDGVDCKPYYFKSRIRQVFDLYKAANGVRLLSHRSMSSQACDVRFRSVHRQLVKVCPKPLRFCTPIDNVSGGFISNFDEATPSRARNGIEGYRYSGLIERGLTRVSEDPAILLARLWVPSTQEYRNTYALRGRTRIAVKRGMLVQRWYDLGPWI